MPRRRETGALVRLRAELNERRLELREAWIENNFDVVKVTWLQSEIQRLARIISNANTCTDNGR